VDWQRKVVKCTGLGAPNLKEAGGNVAVARIGAERAAKMDALRNCMEALRGASIRTGATVGAELAGDAGLKSRVEGLVRGFRVVGAPRYFSDGGVELDVEVPIDGALSDALLPKAEAAQAAPVLASDKGTGLLVDARGLEVTPALAPRLLDAAGRELYGPAVLGPEARRQGGAAYARSVDGAKKELAARLGDRPLVIKAARAQGADLVLGAADAKALEGQKFLTEGRVVIVTD
jgi:hypothetical protein